MYQDIKKFKIMVAEGDQVTFMPSRWHHHQVQHVILYLWSIHDGISEPIFWESS